jgi:hypothetical protein
MGRTGEFLANAERCGEIAARTSPGRSAEQLRHAADCWTLLARLEAQPSPLSTPRPREEPRAGWVKDPDDRIRQVKLSAIDGGWALEIAGVANSLVFKNGARAEDAARKLGARLARAGRTTQVEVYLRGGAFGARFQCIDGAEAIHPRRRRVRA